MSSVSLRQVFCEMVRDPLAIQARHASMVNIKPTKVFPRETLSSDKEANFREFDFDRIKTLVLDKDDKIRKETVSSPGGYYALMVQNGDNGTYLIDETIVVETHPPSSINARVSVLESRKNVSEITSIVGAILLGGSVAGFVLATTPFLITAAIVSAVFSGLVLTMGVRHFIVARSHLDFWRSVSGTAQNVIATVLSTRKEIFQEYLQKGNQFSLETESRFFDQFLHKDEYEPILRGCLLKKHPNANPQSIDSLVQQRLKHLQTVITSWKNPFQS